jgi:hypothetical protein
MYVDALGLLSDAQAVTVDAVSTNTIDLGLVTPQRQIGDGEPIGIGMIVDVAADFTTGDETYVFEVISSAAAALTSPTILGAYTRTAAQLAAGSRHFFPIPPGTPVQRFIGMNYNVGGTTPTITVTAWLTLQSLFDKIQTYADGFTIN